MVENFDWEELTHIIAEMAINAEVERDDGRLVTVATAVREELEPVHAEIRRLRGVANLLADKLACHTGATVPGELREACHAEANGGELWDSIRRMYVDDKGRRLADKAAREKP